MNVAAAPQGLVTEMTGVAESAHCQKPRAGIVSALRQVTKTGDSGRVGLPDSEAAQNWTGQ